MRKLKFVILVLISSCGGDKSNSEPITYPIFPNPMNISMKPFRETILSSMDSITKITDSLFFDFEGRLVKIIEYNDEIRYNYDDKGYLTRYLNHTDFVQNYHITNNFKNNTITQSWYRINHFRWGFSEEDLGDRPERQVDYVVVDGRIVGGFWNNNVEVTFQYDSLGRLIEESHFNEDICIKSQLYNYRNGYLEEQIRLSKLDTIFIRRFENGMLKEIEQGFHKEYPTWIQNYKRVP